MTHHRAEPFTVASFEDSSMFLTKKDHSQRLWSFQTLFWPGRRRLCVCICCRLIRYQPPPPVVDDRVLQSGSVDFC